jgi:hypothetical protein
MSSAKYYEWSMQELQETLRVIFLISEEGFVSIFGGNHESMFV